MQTVDVSDCAGADLPVCQTCEGGNVKVWLNVFLNCNPTEVTQKHEHLITGIMQGQGVLHNT